MSQSVFSPQLQTVFTAKNEQTLVRNSHVPFFYQRSFLLQLIVGEKIPDPIKTAMKTTLGHFNNTITTYDTPIFSSMHSDPHIVTEWRIYLVDLLDSHGQAYNQGDGYKPNYVIVYRNVTKNESSWTYFQ